MRPMLLPDDPINANLLGCWLLGDSGTSGIARDLSPLHIDGQLSGSFALAASHNGGTCLAFDGSTTSVSIPDQFPLVQATRRNSNWVSVVAWVYMTSFANSYNCIFSRLISGGTRGFALYVKSNGKLAVYVQPPSGSVHYDGTGTFTLSLNTWYCIGFSYDNLKGITGYVNGRLDGTAAPNGNIGVVSGAQTNIGLDHGTAGRIPHARIEGVRQWSCSHPQGVFARLSGEPYAGIIERRPFGGGIPPVVVVSTSQYVFVNV